MSNLVPTSTSTLGTRLLDALDAEPRAHARVRQLLCNGDLPSNLPHTFVVWMRDFPSMRPLLGDILHAQSRFGPVVPAQMVLGPLLGWGSTQPWFQKVNLEQAAMAWVQAMEQQHVDKDIAAMRCAWEAFVPIANRIPHKQAQLLCQAWTSCKSLWNPWRVEQRRAPSLYADTVDATLRDAAHVWVDVGIFAVQLGDPSLEKWYHQLQRIFPKSTGPLQQDVLGTFLSSPLPDKVKCNVASYASLELLLQPNIVPQLLACMPQDECKRIDVLLCAKDASTTGGSYWQHANAVKENGKNNEAFLQTYCPVLYDFLNVTFIPDHWMDKTYIANAVQAVMPTPQTSQSIALPSGWDSHPV